MGGVGNETYAGTVFSLDTGKKVTAQELYSLDPNIVTAYFKFEVMEYINTNCGGQRMIYNRMRGDITDGCDEIADYTFDDFSFYLKDGNPILCFEPYLLGPGVSGSFEIPCKVSIFDDRSERSDNALIGQWVGGDHINNLIYSVTFQEDAGVEYMVEWGELLGSESMWENGYIYEGTYDVKDWDGEHDQGNVEIRTSETFETFETYNASWKICFLGRDVIAVTNSDGTPIYGFWGTDGILILRNSPMEESNIMVEAEPLITEVEIGILIPNAVIVRETPMTQAHRVGRFARGTEVLVMEKEISSDGRVWCRIVFFDNGEINMGFVRSDLIQETGEMIELYMDEVMLPATDKGLNVREGPSTSTRKAGTLEGGTQVLVVDEETDSRGWLWYRIVFPDNGKISTGFVLSDYMMQETGAMGSTTGG